MACQASLASNDDHSARARASGSTSSSSAGKYHERRDKEAERDWRASPQPAPRRHDAGPSYRRDDETLSVHARRHDYDGKSDWRQRHAEDDYDHDRRRRSRREEEQYVRRGTLDRRGSERSRRHYDDRLRDELDRDNAYYASRSARDCEYDDKANRYNERRRDRYLVDDVREARLNDSKRYTSPARSLHDRDEWRRDERDRPRDHHSRDYLGSRDGDWRDRTRRDEWRHEEPKLLRRTRWDTWAPANDEQKNEVNGSTARLDAGKGVSENSSSGALQNGDASSKHSRRDDEDEVDGLQTLWAKGQRKANGRATSAAQPAASPVPTPLAESIPTAVKDSSSMTKLPHQTDSLVEKLGIAEIDPSHSRTASNIKAEDDKGMQDRDTLRQKTDSARSSILLPHELHLKGNEDQKPVLPDGKVVEAFRVTHDPAVEKSKPGGQIMRVKNLGHVKDPRVPHAKRKVRREFHLLRWKWDQYSTQPKPPPPPHALTVTGLSKLITQPHVRMQFKSFGRIQDDELKMDPMTGQSMGIYYVRFAHDYDEDLRLLPDASSRPQRADQVCKAARAKFNGQRIGTEIVSVALDDAERSNFTRVYQEERERQAKESKRSSDEAAAQREAQVRPLGISKEAPNATQRPSRPPAEGPPTPRIAAIKARASEAYRSSSDHHQPYRSVAPAYDPRDEYHHSYRSSRHNLGGYDTYDAYSWRDPPRHSHDVHYGRSALQESKESKRDRRRESAGYWDNVESSTSILERLIKVGMPYAFIARSRSSNLDTASIVKLSEGIAPAWTASDPSGWYLAFNDREGASRCRMFLNDKSVNGYRIKIEVRSVQNARDAFTSLSEDAERTIDAAETSRSYEKKPLAPEKTSWNDEELLEDSRLLLLYELGDLFVRDVRTRIVKPFLSDFIRPDRPGGLCINAPVEETPALDDIDLVDIEADRPKTFNRAKREEDRQRRIEAEKAKEAARKKAELLKEREDAKAARAAKRQAQAEAKRARAASPVADIEELGILGSDDEDYYFARTALERMQRGESVTHIDEEAFEGEWDDDEEDDLPLHTSGSARTEGFYRVKPEDKARHVPDRNRAVVDVHQATGLASARDNRADSRRFVQGIEQHKKETATDTDILKFNQLRSRKKQLKFAKSPIHDWGLYAMEIIPAGDMVIEYVGEIVRQQVADEREKTYERQGNFSTYLFRVDDDIVVDATKKGNIARLMNHCCTPNCNAKILTLNGEKRIVLFAKETILPGQELTYDYKFQGTGDDDDAIACLCGSDGCRRFL